MIPGVTLLASLLIAAFAAWVIPVSYLLEAAQPLSVAVSIMMAAVFVRLNRGMPTLDWKSLKPAERGYLTTAIVNLTREYVAIVGINAILLVALIAIVAIKAEWSANQVNAIKGNTAVAANVASALASNGTAVVAAITFLFILSVIRMGYVLWRDLDVVKLQKAAIDAAAFREEAVAQSEIAAGKLAVVRAAGLRQVGGAEIRPWGE